MIEYIETGFTIFDRIIKGVAEWKNMCLSKKAMLRAYYFEVCTNLELLAVIDSKKFKALSYNSPSVFSIVKNLEIQIAAAIVLSESDTAKELFDLLKTTEIPEIKENNNKIIKVKKKLLPAIDFTLRKITLLQKLSSFQGEKETSVIKKLCLEVRTKNIIRHLRAIKYTLDHLNKKEVFLVK
jgi:hypothetical protein